MTAVGRRAAGPGGQPQALRSGDANIAELAP
jgi:hypothetical protein